MERSEGSIKLGTGMYISAALVITICGAVYVFGIQSQRLNDLTERMGRMETYTTDVISMKEQMNQIKETLTEVRQDVKDIKDKQIGTATIKR